MASNARVSILTTKRETGRSFSVIGTVCASRETKCKSRAPLTAGKARKALQSATHRRLRHGGKKAILEAPADAKPAAEYVRRGGRLANITNAPLFVDYTNGNLRLQSNSPCINAGNNAYVTTATDLDGDLRIVSGTVDIGAYEYQGTGSRISYAWLQQYGLSTDGSADYADPDHDGMNNWQEWVCGTNPTNALSVLRMVSARPTRTNAMVTWQSVAGVNYFWERSENLNSPFTLLATNIVGLAGTTSYADTNAAGARPFFFRAGVTAP